jgi:VWFA-related protein
MIVSVILFGVLQGMKRFLFVLLFAFIFGLRAFSQSPTPTPPVEADEDVVKITTNLIQVDVTVTDAKGRVVTDLKPEEIEIYENDQKQNVTHFSFINVDTKILEKRGDDKAREKITPEVPAPPVRLKPEQVRRTIALIIDDLSLSFESVYYVRRALKKFVDEQMQPDDLVAIIRSGKGIGALQQFTSDKRQLYAAIEKVKWYPVGNGGMSAFAPITSEGGTNSIPTDRKSSGDDKDDHDAQAEMDQTRQDVFSVGTLGAINYVVRGMQSLPGRKSIILFSDGFTLISPGGENTRVLDALRHLADQANRAAVVIYTIDARGLQTLGLTAADDVANLSSAQIESRLSDRKNSFFNTQSGLNYLAKVTGGIAIRNNNDLSGGVRDILNDQSGYYLLGYQPDSDTFDPVKRKFNRLTVKVTRPGLKVRYRSGFFGITDEKAHAPVAGTPREQLLNALVSPFSTGELTVKLTPIFGNDPKKGSYINSLIHVKASDLKFTDEADGWKRVKFDIVVIALGDNGTPVDQLSRTETVRVKGDMYDKFLKYGFVYNVPFPIKKPGAYQLRMALRDAETAKIGSANQFIEVPDLRKQRLTLGGIILQNIEDEKSGKNDTAAPDPSNADYIQDTAERKFKSGSALFYNTVIFNPKLNSANMPDLKIQVKLFQGQKEVFTGDVSDYVLEKNADVKRLPVRGALRLGASLPPGEYVLQINVQDMLAGERNRMKTVWLDFEIIK